MSPYLLAFVISDFDYSSLKIRSTLHWIFERLSQTFNVDNGVQFALKNSDFLLNKLERYISIPYELKILESSNLTKQLYQIFNLVC